MSVKIKVSYEEEEELREIIHLLEPKIKSWRKAKKQKGEFKRVYIDIIEERCENY